MNTIYTKEQIQNALSTKYKDLLQWLDQQDEAEINAQKIENKWTAAGHLDHLLRSTRPLNMALRLPLFAINMIVGKKNERPERNFEELVAKYKSKLAAGGTASGPYVPKKIDFSKEKLKLKLNREVQRLNAAIDQWEEEKMSTYLLPHPLLGKLTVREMLFFTVHHTQHHLDILKEKY